MRGRRPSTGSNTSDVPSHRSKNFSRQKIFSSPMSKRMGRLKRRSLMRLFFLWGLLHRRRIRDLAKKNGSPVESAGFLSDGRVYSCPDLGQGSFCRRGFSEPQGHSGNRGRGIKRCCRGGLISLPHQVFLIPGKEYPAEGGLAEEIPKIGVFLCHCGEELKKALSIPDLIEGAKGAERGGPCGRIRLGLPS